MDKLPTLSLTHQLPAEFRVPLIFFILKAMLLLLFQIWRTGSKRCLASLRKAIDSLKIIYNIQTHAKEYFIILSQDGHPRGTWLICGLQSM